MNNRKILLLGGPGISTKIVFNSLNSQFGIHLAIIEGKDDRLFFLKRRIKKLGFFTVAGQVAFKLLIAKPLDLISQKRKNEIIKINRLDISDIPDDKLHVVSLINSESTIQKIKKINPDLIIVNGTKIISQKVLSSIPCKFINTHAGITPKYRGVHGTYWALVNDDLKNSGVTVHFVDAGIDTGSIIDQTQVIPTPKDNFITYPLLQLASGIKLLHKAVEDYFNNRIVTKKGNKESYLWYHPTIWQYLYYRVTKNVK